MGSCLFASFSRCCAATGHRFLFFGQTCPHFCSAFSGSLQVATVRIFKAASQLAKQLGVFRIASLRRNHTNAKVELPSTRIALGKLRHHFDVFLHSLPVLLVAKAGFTQSISTRNIRSDTGLFGPFV